MHLKLFSIEPISMTAPMNITCSDAIQMDSMIRNKWHDDGDDDVMISRIN